MTAIDWELIGEIAPSADWISTTPTTGNAFRFEHHNPPRRVALHIAQTDSTDWLFETRLLSSDRNTQILLMENLPVFNGPRRISLRYADPASLVNNWSVKVYAATIALPGNPDTLHLIDLLTGQFDAFVQAQIETNAQILAMLQTINTKVTTYPSPTPTPTPTPAQNPLAKDVPYLASQSTVYGGREATYALLTDGDHNAGALTDNGPGMDWIQASWPYPVRANQILVGGGYDPACGFITLDGIQLQYSTDNSNWITLATISGNYSGNGNNTFTFNASQELTFQYLRLARIEYCWATELKCTA